MGNGGRLRSGSEKKKERRGKKKLEKGTKRKRKGWSGWNKFNLNERIWFTTRTVPWKKHSHNLLVISFVKTKIDLIHCYNKNSFKYVITNFKV